MFIFSFSLDTGSYDVENTLRDVFSCVSYAFKRRITSKIDYEYLAAACLDPQQLFASYTIEYLEQNNTTAEELLKNMVLKYDLNIVNTSNLQGASLPEQNTDEAQLVSFLKAYILLVTYMQYLLTATRKTPSIEFSC